jgi:polyisoprenoid-binding protein YceI
MSTYTIDAAHSEIQFKIRHLMITNVTGGFTKFEGTLESNEDDFSDAKITFEADVNSITTNNEQRDAHLKSADFFDAEKFPKISFASTSLEKISGEDYKLFGNLTVRDITKPVELEVVFGGTMKDFYGQSKAGFEITGTINRKEFGLTFNAPTETGGVVLSEDVKLDMNVQLIKQA